MDEEYQGGWPPEQGWYDVLVDGEEDRLRHWICQMSGRHEWIDSKGRYIRNANILWIGEADVHY